MHVHVLNFREKPVMSLGSGLNFCGDSITHYWRSHQWKKIVGGNFCDL